MSDAIHDAVTGALYQQMKLEVLSNNLSNINTSGYKKDDIVFLPASSEDNPSDSKSITTPIMEGSQNYSGSFPARTYIDFSQGSLEHTGSDLDLALNGNGFFCVETPEGVQYTRKGNFILNERREICTQEGYKIVGAGGKIVIPGNDVSIDESGMISSKGTSLGSLKIVDFDESSLMKSGNGFFSKINDQIKEKPAAETKVFQGYIEHSNVNPVKMMTDMIDTLRGYESYQKIIQFLGETTSKAINEVGQTV